MHYLERDMPDFQAVFRILAKEKKDIIANA